MTPPRPGHATTAAVSLAAAFALTATGAAPGAAAAPMLRGDYPTWSEVQAAKQNEAATRAEVAKIEKLVIDLLAESDRLGKEALMAAEEANLARAALADAEAKSTRLSAQLVDAQKRADDSAALASGLVARLARAGGGNASMALAFSSESDADELLARLGTMSKLSSSSAALVERALFDKKALGSLQEEAVVAEKERKRLADAAQQAADAAAEAASAVEAQLAQHASTQAVMYAQLASLKGTTAELERQYIEGLANQPTTPPAQQPGSPGGTPGSGQPTQQPTQAPTQQPTQQPSPTPTQQPGNPPPADPTPPPPVPSLVDGAIAFAKAQLGKPYGNSMGPNAYDCAGLVKAAYASVGVYVGPWGSTSQYNYLAGQNRLVPVGQIQAGDLLFYSTGGSASATKYHVAIYLGGGQMLEAPYPGLTVRITSMRTLDLVPYAGRPTG
ncbi:C40 family peptidase [Protaetiibacter sp. SSC-01]|uniref:C40 family peptidase n=1 Tax=Protaetiibacter sp. SSC-01 TaxID=2759943 RepID=UPI001656D3E2|nr:C40 family peptidase [Protaetiibacter sp. SSC-01]QNO37637.1 C40 family peptidase [Protaetiibacter sp. SSC-01]